jgi:hypothetical protein
MGVKSQEKRRFFGPKRPGEPGANPKEPLKSKKMMIFPEIAGFLMKNL